VGWSGLGYGGVYAFLAAALLLTLIDTVAVLCAAGMRTRMRALRG